MSKRKQMKEMYDDGSYVVKKNRKMNIFAFIFCLLIATAIWLYATNTEKRLEAEEQTESQLANIEAIGSSEAYYIINKTDGITQKFI